MILAVGNDGQFGKLAEACGHTEWASDPRFASNAARVAHRDALIPLLCDATRQRTTADWVGALERLAVPCGPINDLAGVFADPQVQHRGIRVDLPHPVAGSAPGVASPLRLSATPVEYRNAPPLLGEHTREVLGSLLCLDEATLQDLERRGVIALG
jgi:crotonobetainyl-CoA:carnitine CoA-transferase CaiB-like acyl-CoA transferase